MGLDVSGGDAVVTAASVTIVVTKDHPLIKLASALPWAQLMSMVLADLKRTTAKGRWWMGRKAPCSCPPRGLHPPEGLRPNRSASRIRSERQRRLPAFRRQRPRHRLVPARPYESRGIPQPPFARDPAPAGERDREGRRSAGFCRPERPRYRLDRAGGEYRLSCRCQPSSRYPNL